MPPSGRPLIMLFSQTGSEIASIISRFGITPSLILTNLPKEEHDRIHPVIRDKIEVMSRRPDVEEYRKWFTKFDRPIVTLHGWLRVIPPEICDEYEIYNGHPGLITADSPKDESGIPILRGKDPQKKAYNLNLDTSGSVIHRVTAGVDEGDIILSKKINIKGLTLDEVFTNLRKCSLELWGQFFYDIKNSYE